VRGACRAFYRLGALFFFLFLFLFFLRLALPA
jgi:hypothetical protein